MLIKAAEDHTSDMQIPVLLTACIDPGNVPSVARRDPSQRLNDYIESVRFWLSVPRIANIVFCENSGYDLSAIREAAQRNNPFHKNIEWLSFVGQPPDPRLGKGYGELRIVEHALNHSEAIGSSNLVLKVTGRLTIANAESIMTMIGRTSGIDIFCDLRKNLRTSDSRLFCASPYFLRNYLLPLHGKMDESIGICFEDILARAVHGAMADGFTWSMLPRAHDLRGVAATVDQKIPSSRVNYLLRELFRSAKARVISR